MGAESSPKSRRSYDSQAIERTMDPNAIPECPEGLRTGPFDWAER